MWSSPQCQWYHLSSTSHHFSLDFWSLMLWWLRWENIEVTSSFGKSIHLLFSGSGQCSEAGLPLKTFCSEMLIESIVCGPLVACSSQPHNSSPPVYRQPWLHRDRGRLGRIATDSATPKWHCFPSVVDLAASGSTLWGMVGRHHPVYQYWLSNNFCGGCTVASM